MENLTVKNKNLRGISIQISDKIENEDPYEKYSVINYTVMDGRAIVRRFIYSFNKALSDKTHTKQDVLNKAIAYAEDYKR